LTFLIVPSTGEIFVSEDCLRWGFEIYPIPRKRPVAATKVFSTAPEV
jgi:hypothetical protein